MTDVVSVDDPGRRGRTVGGPRNRSDGRVYRIQWNDGTAGWTPEYAIEFLDEGDDDVFTLLHCCPNGRVGGVVAEPLPPQTRACAIDALGSSPDRFAQEL